MPSGFGAAVVATGGGAGTAVVAATVGVATVWAAVGVALSDGVGGLTRTVEADFGFAGPESAPMTRPLPQHSTRTVASMPPTMSRALTNGDALTRPDGAPGTGYRLSATESRVRIGSRRVIAWPAMTPGRFGRFIAKSGVPGEPVIGADSGRQDQASVWTDRRTQHLRNGARLSLGRACPVG